MRSVIMRVVHNIKQKLPCKHCSTSSKFRTLNNIFARKLFCFNAPVGQNNNNFFNKMALNNPPLNGQGR